MLAMCVFRTFMVFALCLPALRSATQQNEKTRAAVEPKIIATGKWSNPVADARGYTLRGRLVVCEKRLSEERREVIVYVELQEVSDFVGSSLRLFCDMGRHDLRPEYKGGLHCELRDKHRRPVSSTGFPFSGAIPKSEWLILPKDGTIRVRSTPFGIHRPGALAICPALSHLWIIEDNDPNPYFLSGTFTIAPKEDSLPPGEEHIWKGTLVLPEARIVNTKR